MKEIEFTLIFPCIPVIKKLFYRKIRVLTIY